MLAKYKPGQTYLLCVRYMEQNSAQKALDSFIAGYIPEAGKASFVQTEKGKWVKAITVKNFVVVVFDAPDQDRASALANAMKDRINN